MTPTPDIAEFQERILAHHREHGRHDLPWRNTRDPYAILLSEVMLQQTQVNRVVMRWRAWLERYPTIDALASAPLDDVLREWQGLGYNRRALALKRTAETIAREHGGVVPRDETALRALPGVGPATAAGVRAFAFGLPGVYLETNVRAVFLHEFFADAEGVPDSALRPLIEESLDGVDPRTWYWALLDYGVHLKRTLPNPSRRSAHHARQSPFEGSHRQLRARVLRAVVAESGRTTGELVEMHGTGVEAVLEELAAEGFIRRVGDDAEGSTRWRVGGEPG